MIFSGILGNKVWHEPPAPGRGVEMIFLPAAPGTWEAPLLSAVSIRWHPRWEFGFLKAVLGSEIIIVAGLKNNDPIWMRGKKSKGQGGGVFLSHCGAAKMSVPPPWLSAGPPGWENNVTEGRAKAPRSSQGASKPAGMHSPIVFFL